MTIGETLAAAHRRVAQLLPQIHRALEWRSLSRAQTVEWVAELRAVADALERSVEGNRK